MAHPDGISKWRTVDFGGIVHTLAAGNGDIWNDQNIVSDEYPVLTTRKSERKLSPKNYYSYGVLQIGPAEGDTIMLSGIARYKGVAITGTGNSWISSPQTLTPFNMPAKKWFRTDVIAALPSGSDWPTQNLNVGDVYCVGKVCKYWDGSA